MMNQDHEKYLKILDDALERANDYQKHRMLGESLFEFTERRADEARGMRRRHN